MLFWRYGASWALRQGDWKLVKALRDEEVGLYNLAEDIGEQNNLYRRMPERAQDMHDMWNAVSKDVGKAGWGPFRNRTDRDY